MPAQRACGDLDGEPGACRSSSIFPLRLSAFENYMFVDDRPSHPMTFVIEIEVSGDLRVDELEAAITASLRRHPLLNARILRRWNGRCWVPSPTPPKVEVLRGGAPSTAPLPLLNLRHGPGLQTSIVLRDDGGSIYFCFHHAATDGLGAMQFIGDVLADYAHRTSADDLPERRDVDVQTLRTRACLHSPNVAAGQTPLSRARVFFRQLGRSASLLAVPQALPGMQKSPHPPAIPPFVSRTLDRDFVMGIKQAAARRLLHPNDLYVAALFKTVHDWNRAHAVTDERRVIRLSLPTSLRTPQHDLCPAANVVNMVFLNRLEAECGDLGELLDRAGELANASTHDRVFFRAMRWARCVPGLMELASRLPYSFATMVLTNVGDVKRQFGVRFPLKRGRCVAGSITIEALRGTAPLRPGTHVGISVGTYAGQLFVNAICDPHRYSRADAERFLTLFLSQLDELAAAAARRAAA
jgi:hypothetical protein